MFIENLQKSETDTPKYLVEPLLNHYSVQAVVYLYFPIAYYINITMLLIQMLIIYFWRM